LIIWGTKWIQLKMLSTIELHNFSRYTTSILIFSTSEAVYKIWISNLNTSHEFFYDEMISNQKIASYKVSLHFKTNKFYFGGFSIRGSLKKNQNLNIGLYDKMISNQNIVNYKVS
jgi:cytochrome c-type biogenesis protein CcmE